jgi:hypothetical protein
MNGRRPEAALPGAARPPAADDSPSSSFGSLARSRCSPTIKLTRVSTHDLPLRRVGHDPEIAAWPRRLSNMNVNVLANTTPRGVAARPIRKLQLLHDRRNVARPASLSSSFPAPAIPPCIDQRLHGVRSPELAQRARLPTSKSRTTQVPHIGVRGLARGSRARYGGLRDANRRCVGPVAALSPSWHLS